MGCWPGGLLGVGVRRCSCAGRTCPWGACCGCQGTWMKRDGLELSRRDLTHEACGVGVGGGWAVRPREVVFEGASQAASQRGPCSGRKLGCEPLREAGLQRTLKTITQGRKQASLNRCSSQCKGTPEDMGARQGKPVFSHPHPTLAMEELRWWSTKEQKESLGARKVPPL